MKTYIHYLLASFGLSLILTITRIASKTEPLSLLEQIYFFVATGFFVGSFAYLGKLVRDFVMPDAIVTTSAVDSFKQKLFWAIGPQVIGAVIGFMATQGLHNNLFVKMKSPPAKEIQSMEYENSEIENGEMDPSTISHESN